METQNILEYLNLFSKKYHQINIALKNCENSLKEYIREKESNLAFEDFIIKLDKQNLCFNHSEINYPFIETVIVIYDNHRENLHFKALIPVGYYRLFTMLNGEIVDDSFIMD